MTSPLLTIGIPAYDSWVKVSRVLEHLEAQQTSIPFEIIIVDDCHPEDLYSKIVEHFPRVQAMKNERNSGPALGRNRIIREARGRYIAFLDADCIVHPGWVESLAPYMTGEALVSGRVMRPDNTREWGPRRSTWLGVSLACEAEKADVASSNNLLVSTDTARAVGGFCEDLGIYFEDSLFSILCNRHGAASRFADDVWVVHDHDSRANPKRLVNQARNTIWGMASLYRRQWLKRIACSVILFGYYCLKSLVFLVTLRFQQARYLMQGACSGMYRGFLKPLALYSNGTG